MSTAPLRSLIADALPDRPFSIQLWDGTEVPSTAADGPVFTARSPVALGHMLRSPGQLGLGRAYVSGALEVDDIDKVLAMLDGYSPPPVDAKAKARLMAAAVRAGALKEVPRTPSVELRPAGKRHSIGRDKRAVTHHYDVSNEFFALFLDESMTYSINSLCHFFGRQKFNTKDESRNLLWLTPLSMGEAFHNNHHAFPTSAAHGMGRWDVDPSKWVINAMEKAGLVWDVVRISPERQATKYADAA